MSCRCFFKKELSSSNIYYKKVKLEGFFDKNSKNKSGNLVNGLNSVLEQIESTGGKYMSELEKYFSKYRDNIVGINATFMSPTGKREIIYADWIASGRLYRPIEEKMLQEVGPYVANTHSESSETGMIITHAYHKAHEIIKKHVNAGKDDVLITAGFGMTAVINKLQRIMQLRVPETMKPGYLSSGFPGKKIKSEEGSDRPIVFVTHMEHHSNHTSWLETVADVIVIEPDENLLVDPNNLRKLVEEYKDRKLKIGAFSAASNVTGIIPPYHELAEIMHKAGGICIVDFAASAPYVSIDMHPENRPLGYLDGIVFSPHKFLGGPGSPGVLIFNSRLYHNHVPDNPGGGTVVWTNRWSRHNYITDIEAREDGGTPGFLQSIRAAMAIKLKEEMGCDNIKNREKELLKESYWRMKGIDGIRILAGDQEAVDKIGVVSFYHERIHHSLIVRLLNDLYGIQVRGGCSCAGTYGHYLLHLDRKKSAYLSGKVIKEHDLSEKPGWARISLHPTMTNKELIFIMDALEEIVGNIDKLSADYLYDKNSNEFYHKTFRPVIDEKIDRWF